MTLHWKINIAVTALLLLMTKEVTERFISLCLKQLTATVRSDYSRFLTFSRYSRPRVTCFVQHTGPREGGEGCYEWL